MTAAQSPCPLCAGPSRPYHRNARRDYLQCENCDLVFVPPHQHLSAAAERAFYDTHENAMDDPGYRRFLMRLFEPMAQRLPPGSSGLDFGCGPAPLLAAMFTEAGFAMRIYDPLFAPDAAALEQTYDFITGSEVFEHLAAPGTEIARLLGMLRPGGWLGVMTKRLRNREAFAQWHYIRDPTHVCFFAEATFRFIAARHGLELEFSGPDVALLHKPAA
ncbi:MAG: class I SAM-dependent methyltransferase [Ferrovibrio sp.]|uniref:class I SAM-dependent methyltransferase n=1 Tax=Ferrovibrio sp. TaxID=1917215 RepID=UPI00391DFB9C